MGFGRNQAMKELREAIEKQRLEEEAKILIDEHKLNKLNWEIEKHYYGDLLYFYPFTEGR